METDNQDHIRTVDFGILCIRMKKRKDSKIVYLGNAFSENCSHIYICETYPVCCCVEWSLECEDDSSNSVPRKQKIVHILKLDHFTK